MRSGKTYWRIMADLNPSISSPAMIARFSEGLREAVTSNELYEFGIAQGDKYFYIPALQRHRGVVHFYLEQYTSQSGADDATFAEHFGKTMIAAYGNVLANIPRAEVAADTLAAQLSYHTLYFFQVLTLDRGDNCRPVGAC